MEPKPRPELALLIDGDQVGARNVAAHLERLGRDWNVSARICVRNWRSTKDLAEWERVARECSLDCVQHDPDTRGKNSGDIELAVRAMDLLHGQGYRAFCILSKDTDFKPLERRLKRAGCHIEMQPLGAKAPAAERAAPPARAKEPPKPSPPRARHAAPERARPPAPEKAKPAEPARFGPDKDGFARVVANALDECIQDGDGRDGGVPVVRIGQVLPEGRKAPDFGFPKGWSLSKAIGSLPGFEVSGGLVRRKR